MKRFIFCIFSFLLFFNTILFSQSQFQLKIGDSTHGEEARSIIQTTDGGFIAVGESDFSIPGGHMYIVKLNSSGQLQWSRTISSTIREVALSVVQTTDGGYAVAGYSYSFGAYFVKFNPEGTVEWARGFAGDPAWSVVQTADGGYAAVISPSEGGYSPDRMIFVKLDSMGMPQWSKRIEGNSYARCIRQTTDKGYVLAGTTSVASGDFNMFIVKLDSNGSMQWAKTVGDTGQDYAYSIVQTFDGGYAAAGVTYSFGNSKMYIVKLDSSGIILWTKVVGVDFGVAYSIIQTTDSGYAAAGDIGGGGGIPIIKLQPDGSLQWSRIVNGSSGQTYARSIIQTTDGCYVAAGFTCTTGDCGMFIVKFDNNGNTCVNSTSPSISVGTGGILRSIFPTITSPTLSAITPTPVINSQGSVTPICVIGIQPISNEIPVSFKLYQNYPNPFNPVTKIKFSLPRPSEGGGHVKLIIFDVLGSEIVTLVNETFQPGTYEVEWDGTNYASGVYYYKIETGDYKVSKKMVLIK